MLRRALEETKQRQAEISALLKGTHTVLESRDFYEAARSIFNSCKSLIGATAGYIALLSKDGTQNEVAFLDSGGLPCSVDPNIPMPIRGLRGIGYRTGKTVYHNDFSNSEFVEFIPQGHVRLENVLFAPPDDRDFVKKAVNEALYGKPYSIDHRIILPDGTVRIVHEQGEVTFGESGEPIRMLGTVQDITEKKETEMQLIMSERLSALGQMASGIAHEINNPLATIGGCAEGLLNRINKGQVDHELFKKNYFKIIDEEVTRCKKITTNMLSFVRRGTYEKSYVNAHEILDKTLELISLQGRLKGVSILRNYGEGVPLI